MNRLAFGVFLLDRDGLTKELYAQQSRLAALPGEIDLVSILPLDVLTDVGFQPLIRHLPGRAPPTPFLYIHFFFFQIKAVRAVEVTDGAYWLRHDVKSRSRWLLCAHGSIINVYCTFVNSQIPQP